MSPLDVCFLQECHLQEKRMFLFFRQGGRRDPLVGGWGMLEQMGGYFIYSWEFVIESTNVIIPGRVVVVDARWRGGGGFSFC